MIDLDAIEFQYEPFPIGLASPVIAPDLYREMVSDYPPLELFEHTPGTGLKYVLSEKNHPKAYRDYIESRPHWREFHRYLKSRDFIRYVLATLERKHIDIGLESALAPRSVIVARSLAALLRGQAPHNATRLQTTFQFSTLPGDGGFIRPHTDSPKKRITLILSILGEGEWDPAHGGGTDLNRAKNPEDSYNWSNRSLDFEDVEILRTYEFLPNQCVLFVKTFNSLHSVRPMTAPARETARRTLTINLSIER